MVKLIHATPVAFIVAFLAANLSVLSQSIHTHNSTNDMVAASFNPSSQNTNHYVLTTNDMSYQHWVWWSGDASADSTYNLESLRPGVVGRFKLVENLHWNHIPDVNGDTFVIIHNTNQGGLVGALTVPYIPRAIDTNKLADSHLYWLGNGTGTDTNLYFGPGTTNVLYRSGSDLVVTNGNTANSKLTLYNGNAIGLSMVAQGPTSAAIQTEGAGANTLILRQNTDQVSLTTGRFAPTIDSTESLGSLNDKWLNLHLSGTNTLWTLYDPLAPTVNYDYTVLEKSATNGPFVIDQRTGGTAGYSRGFSFRTNGVEIFSATGTGGPSSGANWTAVGTTDSSLAGTATAGSFDVPLLSLGDVNTNLVIDFATLGFRTANLTNDSYITVTGMPATVARTLEYKIFTGNTNRNVFWQVGLSNSMGAPLPAILPSNNVVRLTLQSTGTTVTNVDAYVTWRTP